MPIDSSALAIIGLSFLLAGVLKGAVGLGLSTVSLALLTVTIGLQPVMVLLLAPSFVTHGLRQQIPAAHFRRVFFVALLALGLYVLTQSL
jgi:hypothetical protein